MEKSSHSSHQSHIYASNYIRNSKAVGVLWGVFTICFAIINIVVFIQPEWIGDTHESKGTGFFGLWKWCTVSQAGGELECTGQLTDFNTILTGAFRASTVLVGLSVVCVLMCVCAMLLFFFLQSSTVYYAVAWMELLAAVLSFAGLVIFPHGWSAPEVREVCGPTARQYHVGECGLRWAYVLAIIGVVDAVILSALAFVLASRSVSAADLCELEPEYVEAPYKASGHINNGYVNDSSSLTGSRKSLNLQPVMLLPQPEGDRYSDFPHGPPRHAAGPRVAPHSRGPTYAVPLQSYQL